MTQPFHNNLLNAANHNMATYMQLYPNSISRPHTPSVYPQPSPFELMALAAAMPWVVGACLMGWRT